jgi:hypothetical protein
MILCVMLMLPASLIFFFHRHAQPLLQHVHHGAVADAAG